MAPLATIAPLPEVGGSLSIPAMPGDMEDDIAAEVAKMQKDLGDEEADEMMKQMKAPETAEKEEPAKEEPKAEEPEKAEIAEPAKEEPKPEAKAPETAEKEEPAKEEPKAEGEVITSWLLSSLHPTESWKPRQFSIGSGKVHVDQFQHAWKDQTADSTVELHVVEPYVEDYPGQPSLHAILVKNPEAMKQVPVLVEVKDEKSQQQKWKAAWVKNPVTFESLAAIDQKGPAQDLDQMQITVFDIHLKQGQMIKVNQGDLIKFVVPEERFGKYSASEGWWSTKGQQGALSDEMKLSLTKTALNIEEAEKRAEAQDDAKSATA